MLSHDISMGQRNYFWSFVTHMNILFPLVSVANSTGTVLVY